MLSGHEPALISISAERYSIAEAHERDEFFPFYEETLQLFLSVIFVNCSPKILHVFRRDFDQSVKFLQAVMHDDLLFHYTPYPAQ